MKREILFKAKDFVGDWLIGGNYEEDKLFEYHYISRHRIHPETLCQFIGAVDKNGVKIFEGDIDKSGLFVAWNQLHFEYGLFNGNGATKHKLLLSPEKNATGLYSVWTDDSIEIVGNIYDNYHNKKQ